MPKRIIPVSSGKGGVGKTTVATNFALSLSRFAPTILVDLDTGTSSVRSSIGVPVAHDLYHFFRKGRRLDECVTRLPDSWDPDGLYRGFGFVAGPLHLIEEVTNFGPEKKARLCDAINELPADYVILDMKAGLDANVVDFLPWSNSGILVFTPHLPSATLAASDIVKAILFRKLRIVFSPSSPFYAQVKDPRTTTLLVNDLLDEVEDVYEPGLPNLDAFLVDLAAALGDHPVLDQVARTVEHFRVHYVLNSFNGVDEAFDTAVKPFVENLVSTVSERMTLTNLGWVVRSDEIHQGNCRKRPVLLAPPDGRPASRPTRGERELDALIRETAGLAADPRPRKPVLPVPTRPDPESALARELDALNRMYHRRGNRDDPRDNFDYLTARALHLLERARPSEFGTARLVGPVEILRSFFPGGAARPAG
ncbi:MAG TPA: P-loop NTPase [Thermoanaerobaculia bacterium]|jgi:MinD-like ATPase involved in chromosome partitioning or flagellar assembly|nr:P-loop NTPase [Thermoanaerobaculia bacterium]HPA50159.1 P-loop NTPase [Thermoanaerobaculia bacterium]HQN07719.1 P-loop NTPase [Thermoanaerobaculia bacterium]HQP85102.1 P-loop NTPase [Thermoanaerobaculia bacterium]